MSDNRTLSFDNRAYSDLCKLVNGNAQCSFLNTMVGRKAGWVISFEVPLCGHLNGYWNLPPMAGYC